MFMKNEVSFEIISKYRTEWMGLAMLQILLYHIVDGWLGYGDFFNTLDGWTGVACSFLNTKAFLFLSGFGLFYSLNKAFSLRKYYTNRILRLFPAYIICSIIWYICRDIIQEHNILRFAADMTLTSFWGWGNEWYLAVSLLLYLLFPLYFFCIRNVGIKSHLFCLALVICLIFSINVALNHIVTDYYQMIRIGLGKLHFFFIGAFVAYLSIKKVKCNALMLAIVLFAIYILHVFIKHRFFMEQLPELFYDLMYEMALFGALMLLCNYSDILKRVKFLTWMGKYSLEIYLLHMYVYNVLTKFFHCEYYLVIVLLCTFLLAYPVHVLSGKISSVINRMINKASI